ncbi:hypothetical protein MNBD_BACTEROID01-1357 [hydrothermal vent metagenome]|uniref:Uncharacterized protein n=1 Tax=hydrothermal vent metagenome TaxID=652676 RepID=A0A3B0T7V7_9ZZZZ
MQIFNKSTVIRRRKVQACLLFVFFMVAQVNAQISPGKLSKSHEHLSGMSNCTKCHVLGEKETTPKCLECHKEIQNLQNRNKGYHASQEVKPEACAMCHGEHFGREFKLINIDENSFDHNLAGYKLEGKHNRLKCKQCHKNDFIKTKISQKKGFSYLGLGTECLSCHADYHQNTLPANCLSCHSQNTFRPAPGFNHSQAKFPLKGKHAIVKCEKCHKKEERGDTIFQQFANVAFSSCTNCHADIHKNKFGGNCTGCHTVESFRQVKNLAGFNHDKTNYPLKGKHQIVKCKKCHVGDYTNPVKHANCTDCHSDYHEKQFQEDGASPDCRVCHSVKGFTPSLYTIEEHNQSGFTLEGAHLATPCFACHKPGGKWDFSKKGGRCVECHENIHKNYMDKKFMPADDCKNCHSVALWPEISFDHNKTDFPLEGKHRKAGCRQCHFKTRDGETIQQFVWKTRSCTNCHADKHNGQFAINGITTCEKCHTNNNWHPTKFNHTNTRFKLDGEHIDVACAKCHKPDSGRPDSYIAYKFNDISCASCHLQ